MSQWLRQSTAGTVPLGPFVGTADGYTASTALTISQGDIRLSKNGGAFAQTNNSAGAAHMENGYYAVPFDTTDTNTLGRLRVAVNETGALPVWADFMVVPSQVWDSFFATDKLQVHVDEMTAGIITAAVIATDAANEIADAVLSRGVSNVEDSANTTSLAAVILAMLESSISGTTWTIRKTGGGTFVTKTVTVDDTADPITGVT